MANKPLKTIKFPGLPDTYTIPQIDDTLSNEGEAADASAVGKTFLGFTVARDSLKQGSSIGPVVDTRIRTDKFKVTNGIKITFVAGTKTSLFGYTTFDENNNMITDSDWYGSGTYTIKDGSAYCILVFRKANNASIAPSDYDAETSVTGFLDLRLSVDNSKLFIPKDNFEIGWLQSASCTVAYYIDGIAYPHKIPVNGGETIRIELPELDGVVYHYRFAQYYASNGTYKSQVADTTNNMFTLASDCGYFAFTVGAYDAQGRELETYNLYEHLPDDTVVKVVFIEQLKTSYTDRDEVQKMIDDNANHTDIVSLNKEIKEKLIQAKRPLNATGNSYLSVNQPLVLLHFSDIHGDKTELQRMVKFKNAYDSMIDDAICTGDLVELRWTSDFDYWGDVDGAENILLAIGNHDVLTDPSGWDWSQRATQSAQNSRYIAPFVENWNCTIDNGKTYYYKDYAAKKIRLIVLNCMLTGDDDTAQLSWLTSVLSTAKSGELHVIVANHYTVATPEKIACNFSTIDQSVGSDVLPLTYLSAIQDFIDGGGNFICHIAGHTHWDLIVKSTTYPNQLCIVVDALSRAQGNQYSDTQRTDDTRSQDLANLIAFDTASQVVKIMRVGANVNHYLCSKNSITINYSTGAIITQN